MLNKVLRNLCHMLSRLHSVCRRLPCWIIRCGYHVDINLTIRAVFQLYGLRFLLQIITSLVFSNCNGEVSNAGRYGNGGRSVCPHSRSYPRKLKNLRVLSVVAGAWNFGANFFAIYIICLSPLLFLSARRSTSAMTDSPNALPVLKVCIHSNDSGLRLQENTAISTYLKNPSSSCKTSAKLKFCLSRLFSA